jgi:hypothetical protein
MRNWLSSLIVISIFLVLPSGASALLHWEYKDGERILKNGTETVKDYTGGEYDAARHQLEAIRECFTRENTESECGKEIHDDNTGVDDPNYTVDDSAQSVVDTGRSEGTSLASDVTGPIDNLGEAAGALDESGAATAIGGPVLLGAGAFTVGVAIGLGLDQLFGDNPFDETEESEEVATTTEHKCYLDHKTEKSYFTEEFTEGVEIQKIELPIGYYQNCVSQQAATRYTNFQGTYECKDNIATEGVPPIPGPLWKIKKAYEVREEDEYSHSCEEQILRIVRYEWAWIEPECKENEALEQFFAAELPKKAKCYPVGLPNKELLTKTQEKANTEHFHPGEPPVELEPHPETKIPAIKPLKVGSAKPMPEELVEKTLEIEPTRKFIEEKGHKTPKELHESELEEELEIPPPRPNELGSEYVTELESDGFTDVTLKTLPESDIDSRIGPEEVSYTAPAEGTRTKSTTKITVEQNPDNAPTPAEPTKGIGGPTLPGIHFPDFGVLCKGFPFGVPCWLVGTIESWSVAGEAPELGIESFEIEHHKIPGAKFKLNKLEPIMEKVRPAMLIFATIGIVLLFYGFAKGGGAPSGSQGEGYFGGQELPADNDQSIWERFGDGS